MRDDKASSTALFVANGLWHVSQSKKLSCEITDEMRVYNDAFINTINPCYISSENFLTKKLLHLKTSLMQYVAQQGFYLHFSLRKRCIEALLTKSIEQGAEQVVVIGAGFDTLALRYAAKYSQISFFELDHPATQKVKVSAVEKNAELHKHTLNFLSLDISKQSMKALLEQTSSYDSCKKTTFILEGVSMYLQESEVKQLFKDIHALSVHGSDIIFTYMQEKSEKNFQFQNASAFMELWLKVKKETFTWGVKPSLLQSFLHELDYELIEHYDDEALRYAYLTQKNKHAALAKGESVVLSRSRASYG